MSALKTLILSCSTGEGHNSAARAVQKTLAESGVPCELVDALRFAGEKTRELVTASFNDIAVRAPAVFGLAYKAGGRFSATGLTSPVYLANSLYARALSDYVTENGFDSVVCTHLFPMEAVTFLRRHHALPARCYAVLTDYTCIPFLEETDMDGYFLPHDVVREDCLRHGMPAERLFVTGLPVARRFLSTPEMPQARRALNLPEDQTLFLIMTGGIGCGNVLDLCDAVLREYRKPFALYVLTGRNAELLEQIHARYGADPRVRALPFTDQVHLYMAAADVLLSKPGGISSTEAAAVGVPLVHAMAIPGCETQNASFFEKLGMSLFARDTEEAARCAALLASDRSLANHMRAAQKTQLKHDGASNVMERMKKDEE